MLEIKDNNLSSLKDKECFLLFYFTASWCGPCKKIKPLIEKLSEGLDKSMIEIYMINIDENEELSNQYNIKSVPTFLLIQNNKEKGKCSGADITKVHKLLKDNMK